MPTTGEHGGAAGPTTRAGLLRADAVRIAREAAELVATNRKAGVTGVRTKSSVTDVVTASDRASERLIRRRLGELWPDAPVIGEEDGGAAPAGGLSWVVDPIDGTVNYLYGLPHYAVSVAAQVDGISVAGAIVDPNGGRVWEASTGDGAWCDGQPLRVSETTRLELALVATGFAYRAERRARQAGMWARLLPLVRDIRRSGASTLESCAVAAGWVDAYVEHGLGRWDWAAGALIAAEAGATVWLPGDPDGLGPDGLLIAAPGIADALRAELVRVGALEV